MITVVTAPESTMLTSLASLKAILGITSTTNDALMQSIIIRASSLIQNFCQRDFALTQVKERVRVNGRDFSTIKLLNWPVQLITEIKYQGAVVDAADYTLYELEKGFIQSASGKEWEYTGRIYDYEVNYTYGYVLPSFTVGTPNLPQSIELAALQVAKSIYLTKDKHPGVKLEEVPNVYKVAYAGGDLPNTAFNQIMTPDVQMLLRPFKKVRL